MTNIRQSEPGSDRKAPVQETSAFAGIIPTKLYTTQDVSQIAGLTVSYFEAARMRGGGPEYVKVGSRSVRYLGQSLIEWLSKGRRTNTSQSAPGME